MGINNSREQVDAAINAAKADAAKVDAAKVDAAKAAAGAQTQTANNHTSNLPNGVSSSNNISMCTSLIEIYDYNTIENFNQVEQCNAGRKGQPCPPVITSAFWEPGNNNPTINWHQPTKTGAPGITSYKIKVYNSSDNFLKGDDVLNPSSRSGQIFNLSKSQSYKFGIVAINKKGESLESNKYSLPPPAPPPAPIPTNNVRAVTAIAGNGQANVTWTVPTNNSGSNIYYYVIKNNVDENMKTFVYTSSFLTTTLLGPGRLSGTPSTATVTTVNDLLTITAIVPALINGTPYIFTVQPQHEVGLSPVTSASTSNSVTPKPVGELPQAPILTSLEPGNESVTVNYLDVQNGVLPILSYNLYVNNRDGLSYKYEFNNDSNNGKLNIVANKLKNDEEYFFTMTAINEVGESLPSNRLNATPMKPPPPNQIPVMNRYFVFYKKDTPPPYMFFIENRLQNNGGQILSVNRTLGSFVAQLRPDLLGELLMDPAIQSIKQDIGGLPQAPILTSLDPGNESVTVNYLDVQNGASPILSYVLFVNSVNSISGFSNSYRFYNDSNKGKLVVNELKNGEEYSFTMTAINAVGESLISNTLTATPRSPEYYNKMGDVMGVNIGMGNSMGNVMGGNIGMGIGMGSDISMGIGMGSDISMGNLIGDNIGMGSDISMGNVNVMGVNIGMSNSMGNVMGGSMGMGNSMGNLMGGSMGMDNSMGNVMGANISMGTNIGMGANIGMGNVMGVTGLNNSIQLFGNVSQTRTGNSRTSKLPTGVYSSNNMSMYASVRNY